MEAYLLKNVQVIDPDTKQTEKRDVCIKDGVFADSVENGTVIEMDGCYLAPGFIDLHMHAFENKTPLGIEVDKVGIRQGVLTVVDAGSTGIRDFDSFQKDIIDKSVTNVKFFLNIARQGLCDGLSELADMNDLITLDELLEFKKHHGENLVGLKVRMSSSVVKDSGIKPLEYARKLSDETGLPIMVHIGNAPPPLGEVLNLLRKGDILTHCFHGKKGGLCDYKEEFINAADRGVHFDVGHGNASFSIETMPKVMAIKPIDFSISTDIYNSNFEKPVGSLMQTMSKFLAAGLTIEEIVYKVTSLPAKVLKLKENKVYAGEAADCTIFKLVPKWKEIQLIDSEGVDIPSEKIILPVMTIKNGKKVWEGNV